MKSHDPPGWVRPERLPWDLPPHEQWATHQWEITGAPAKHPPHTAPGFTRAYQLGLLPPPPPAEPPVPLPGRSAGQLGLLAIAFFLSPLVVTVPLVGRDAVFIAVGVVLGSAAHFTAWKLLRALTRRAEAEAAAGYTTTWGSPGLWRLTPRGRPVRPPDRRFPPDGFYPSPYWPGVLQKWEGQSWKPFVRFWWKRPEDWFRTPRVPYLQ